MCEEGWLGGRHWFLHSLNCIPATGTDAGLMQMHQSWFLLSESSQLRERETHQLQPGVTCVSEVMRQCDVYANRQMWKRPVPEGRAPVFVYPHGGDPFSDIWPGRMGSCLSNLPPSLSRGNTVLTAENTRTHLFRETQQMAKPSHTVVSKHTSWECAIFWSL